MFIQIHMLQSMPPGNLNRDETGQPKKCIFGGVTRGRISSQCLKRNIRRSTQFVEAFGDALADRTTYLPRMVADELREANCALGIPESELDTLMAAIAGRFKSDKAEKEEGEEEPDGAAAPEAAPNASNEPDDGQTGQLVFFQQPFARSIAELLAKFRKDYAAAYLLFRTGEVEETDAVREQRKNRKKELAAKKKKLKEDKKSADTDAAKDDIAKAEVELKKEEQTFKEECEQSKGALAKKIDELIAEIFKASRSLTVDIGLFGRMTTSDLVVNVEASCQVAHAISTHETIIESDYFTAMDERKSRYVTSQVKNAGAAFLGSGETETFFDAAVYYKYLNFDLDSLRKHLQPWPDEQASKTVAALLSAAALSNPSGKQNSFASHGIPQLILVEVSKCKRPISYANAFLQPVEGPNYLASSAEAIKSYIESVATAFQPADMKRYLLAVGDAKVTIKDAEISATLDQLVKKVANVAVPPTAGTRQ